MGSGNMLRAVDLNVSFGDNTIIEKSSFFIKKGDKVGVIGDNGSGKTTLLKCIAGLQEYSGKIFVSSELKIGYQEQDINFSPESYIEKEYEKVFEEIIEIERKIRELEKDLGEEEKYREYLLLLEKYEKKNRNLYRKKIIGVAKGLGFKEKDFKKPFKYFSGGELVKAAIGKVILKEPDILLLDEPSNHLDIDSIEWLERLIKNLPSTVIMVSHDKYFLNRVSNKILEIEFKHIRQYDGNYDKYILLKENYMKTLEREQKNLLKEIKRNEEMIRKLKSYGRDKLARQALSREKKIEKLKENVVNIEKKEKIKIEIKNKDHVSHKVLTCLNLSKSFEKELFKNVSFEIHGGEKVGLIGPNGSGKSTLLKMITGIEKYEGKIFKGYNVKIGYYDQKLEVLDEGKNVFENLKIEMPNTEDYKVRKILGRYLFTGEDVFKKTKELSGGEKARLALAKILIHEPNFLILDEPTNHLDIGSREIITHSLKSFNGTILVVSHDRFLLDSLCDRILVLGKNGVKNYLGNFTYYYENKYESQINKASKKSEVKNGKILYEKRKKLRRMKNEIEKEEKNLEEIEKEMEKTEKEIDALYNDISGYIKINEMLEKKKKLEEKYLEKIELIEKLKFAYEEEQE